MAKLSLCVMIRASGTTTGTLTSTPDSTGTLTGMSIDTPESISTVSGTFASTSKLHRHAHWQVHQHSRALLTRTHTPTRRWARPVSAPNLDTCARHTESHR
jgi:hypothetical protein